MKYARTVQSTLVESKIKIDDIANRRKKHLGTTSLLEVIKLSQEQNHRRLLGAGR